MNICRSSPNIQLHLSGFLSLPTRMWPIAAAGLQYLLEQHMLVSTQSYIYQLEYDYIIGLSVYARIWTANAWVFKLPSRDSTIDLICQKQTLHFWTFKTHFQSTLSELKQWITVMVQNLDTPKNLKQPRSRWSSPDWKLILLA